METLFRSNKIELYSVGNDTHALVLYNSPRLAKKLNLFLNHYPSAATFDLEDEVKFTFKSNKLESVCARLRINSLNIIKVIKG